MRKAVIKTKAEELKENLLILLSESPKPPFDIRGTMDLLIDQIASLEFDGPEDPDAGDRSFISRFLAVNFIGHRESVHVYRNPHGMLIGADWSWHEVLALLERAKTIEIGGRTAIAMKHPIVVDGSYFIEAINFPFEVGEDLRPFRKTEIGLKILKAGEYSAEMKSGGA